jgi:hypothetical protein
MLALAACGMVWGYLGVLLIHTELGAFSISVGNPVILAMLGACVTAICLAAWCLLDPHIPRQISCALFIAALAPTATFIWLHRSEAVCDFRTEFSTACVRLF